MESQFFYSLGSLQISQGTIGGVALPLNPKWKVYTVQMQGFQ